MRPVYARRIPENQVQYETIKLDSGTEYLVAICQVEGRMYFNVRNYNARVLPKTEETGIAVGRFALKSDDIDITDCFVAEPRAINTFEKESSAREGLYIAGPSTALDAVMEQLKIDRLFHKPKHTCPCKLANTA